MSLAVVPFSVSYAGNGSDVTPYPLNFKFLHETHITAAVDGVPLDLADYEVTGAGDDNGGNLTTTLPIPPESTITITRTTPKSQPTVLINGTKVPPKTIETALDRLTMLAQETDKSLFDYIAGIETRALLFPTDEDPSHSKLLPIAEQRRDKVIHFDPSTGEMKIIRMDQLAQRLLTILGVEAVLPQRVIEITDHYTLTKEESNALIRINSTEDILITLPTTGEDFDQSFGCIFQRIGTGQVTFTSAPGVIIDSDYLRIFGRYTGVSCHWVGTDRWTIYGDLY